MILDNNRYDMITAFSREEVISLTLNRGALYDDEKTHKPKGFS